MTAWTRLFAQPWALWLLLALPALSVLWAWARWRRRRALRRLGASYLIERLLLVRPRLRRWQSMLVLLALAALILGIAGPRWGVAHQPELLGGKDIVVVLDMSKSMLAEQPSRFERARRSLRDLAEGLETRGGHRVALVVFAAHAKLQFPLTVDYDHFRFALEQLDADNPAPELRPQGGEKIASGTRIGAALSMAVAAHAADDRAGRQDIILLSDGDDPAGDDEWRRGLQAAHERSIPVHVVAIGDPQEAHRIPRGGDVIRHDRVIVQTKLNEPLLQEIARRSGGIYLPAHRTSLPLGKLLRGYLESAPDSDAVDSRVLQPEPHFSGFVLAALLLLGATMLVGDGPPFAGKAKMATDDSRAAQPRQQRSVRAWAVILLLPWLVSAEPLTSIEDAVRQGNAAFLRGDFESALQFYAQAAPSTSDPGLIAFNQGAALFRLGRFDEAAAHYQRCLEDQAAPRAREARASYDLGAALMQGGHHDRSKLERAIAALRRCLELKPGDDLQTDALHNLELAKWLWIQAKPAPASEPPNAHDSSQDPTLPPDRGGDSQSQTGAKLGPGGVNEGGLEKGGGDQVGMNAQKKKLSHGPLHVLPDTDRLEPLTPEETSAHLEQLIARIQRERRQYWRQATPAPANVKDW